MFQNIVKTVPLLKASNISVTYEDSKGNPKTILKDINIHIEDIIRPDITQGQVASIVSQSGRGKSTILKILAGLQKPTTGTVKVGLNQKDVERGDMGLITQNYFIYPWRRVNEILEKSIKKNIKIKPEDRKEIIHQYLLDFDLIDQVDKFPAQLSGGQRQRVAIVQQLVNGSDFLLFDEPFSGLDCIIIDNVVKILRKVSLSDELKTLIIVSHDIETSVALSDTVFVLAKVPEGHSTIVKEIDLIARDLAYHEDIKELSGFRDTIKEIKSLMK